VTNGAKVVFKCRVVHKCHDVLLSLSAARLDADHHSTLPGGKPFMRISRDAQSRLAAQIGTFIHAKGKEET
jgi:hypothetical protein